MPLWAVARRDDGLKPLAISRTKADLDAGFHLGRFASPGAHGNLSLAPVH
jgi:hypothetical protein